MMGGKHNFVVGSNVTNFFAIGDFMTQDDFFAIGHFKSNGDFAIDAKLYSSSGDLIATIKDNQVDIKGEKFQQINTVEKDNFHALEVIDTNGIQVLYVEMTEKKPIVEITGRLYDKMHREIATGTKNDLIVHNGKMVLGASKSGSMGIVINCSNEECAFLRKYVQSHLS